MDGVTFGSHSPHSPHLSHQPRTEPRASLAAHQPLRTPRHARSVGQARVQVRDHGVVADFAGLATRRVNRGLSFSWGVPSLWGRMSLFGVTCFVFFLEGRVHPFVGFQPKTRRSLLNAAPKRVQREKNAPLFGLCLANN